MKKFFLVHVFLLARVILAIGQSQETVWKMEWGGNYPNNAAFVATKQVDDGVIAIVERTGFSGNYKPARPLVNLDTVGRHWIMKFSYDGKLRWKYLMDYCHGTSFHDFADYVIQQKNDRVFIYGKVTYHQMNRCENSGKYIILAIDKNGKEIFFRRLNYKPEYVKPRKNDFLIFKSGYDIAIRAIDFNGVLTSDSTRIPLKRSFYQADVNERDEVFIFTDGHVTQLNSDLTLKSTFDFAPDYSTRKLGHPDDDAVMKVIGDDKVIVYYSNYRSDMDKDSLGRYNQQVYLLCVDMTNRKFWFLDTGRPMDDDLIINAWVATDRLYLSYFAYENPANLKRRNVIGNLHCYSLSGNLLWNKSYSIVPFYGSMPAITDQSSVTCFYTAPPAAYHASTSDFVVKYEKVSHTGETIANKTISLQQPGAGHLKDVYRIDGGDYIIAMNFEFKCALFRMRLK